MDTAGLKFYVSMIGKRLNNEFDFDIVDGDFCLINVKNGNVVFRCFYSKTPDIINQLSRIDNIIMHCQAFLGDLEMYWRGECLYVGCKDADHLDGDHLDGDESGFPWCIYKGGNLFRSLVVAKFDLESMEE